MRVTKRLQVTLPKEVRDALGLQAGDEVDFEDQGDGTYRIVKIEPERAPSPQTSPFRAARGSATVNMPSNEIKELTRGEE